MLRFVTNILLRSVIEKDQSNKKRFLHWDKIEKIALIVSKSENPNKSALDKFINDSKKFAEVYYVDTGAKEPSYSDWHCFTKKDVSFWKLPKGPVMDELKKKNFDLVINTADEQDLFAVAICACLPATFKCGRSATHNDVGLIISRAPNIPLTDYLNDILRYLKMIKP